MKQIFTRLRIAMMAGLILAGTTTVGFSQAGKRTVVPPARLSPSTYLSHHLIRIELGIDVDQRQQLSDLKRESGEFSRKLFRELQNTPVAERQKKLGEFAAKRAKRKVVVERRIQAILTKEQQKRLREIAIQLRGPQAFCTKDLIDALKIDKQQQSKMQQIRGERAAEIGKLLRGRGFGAGATRAMLKSVHQLETRLTAKAVELLSKEQKAKYESMIGQEFDRSKITGGRF